MTGPQSWQVAGRDRGSTLASFLRARLPASSWATVKAWITSGKVQVAGRVVLDPAARMREGAVVELVMTAPRRLAATRPEVRIVYEDTHVVVIDKPAGVSSVPYEARETDTAMDLVRDAWRRQGRPATATPLFVVHRIDKETSGLLVFAKTKRAERGLAAQFRRHEVERTYLCVAHGEVRTSTIESFLVADRGDGLRGSARGPGVGKLAITHVAPVRPLPGATLCEVRLETGKTHQIRIHLAERGHPLVGEKVYVRDFVRRGGAPIESPRLLLHAATLGFIHPLTAKMLRFEAGLPADFAAAVRRVEGAAQR